MVEYHSENANLNDLITKWLVFGFGKRRKFDPNNPRDNTELPGKKSGKSVLVLVCLYSIAYKPHILTLLLSYLFHHIS